MKKGKEVFTQAYNIPHLMVSNHGNVWSMRTKKMLKLTKTIRGYLRLQTSVGGVPYQIGIHRLMRQSFDWVNFPEKHVAHVDGNPGNNVLSNLKWCTPWENNQDRYKHKTIGFGHKNGMAKITNRDAKYAWHLVQCGLKSRDVARIFDCGYETINSMKHGRSWNHITGKIRTNKYVPRTKP